MSDDKLTSEEIEALLKEWELSQENAIRYNSWAWQIGSIFIILSLAALWAATQIENVASRWQYSWVLCFFSLSTILTWYFFVVRRARHFISICYNRIYEIEEKMKKYLKLEKDELPLHTGIREKDKCYKTRTIYGVYLFVFLTIVAWTCVLLLNFLYMINYL